MDCMFTVYAITVEELSRRSFFRNHLGTFLNDELYAQTKVFAKKSLIFENIGGGRPKNNDFWSLGQQIL